VDGLDACPVPMTDLHVYRVVGGNRSLSGPTDDRKALSKFVC
jgi:hypothetical protein